MREREGDALRTHSLSDKRSIRFVFLSLAFTLSLSVSPSLLMEPHHEVEGQGYEEALEVTGHLSKALSHRAPHPQYRVIGTLLRGIRSLLNNESERYVDPLTRCSLHSLLTMHWPILVENMETTEESFKCLLPLCRDEANVIGIAEELLQRGIHIFCVHAIRRYTRNKNIKIHAVELLSLLEAASFSKNSAVYLQSALDENRSRIIQEILIHGGLSLISSLIVDFSYSNSHCITLKRLLQCKSQLLFVVYSEMND